MRLTERITEPPTPTTPSLPSGQNLTLGTHGDNGSLRPKSRRSVGQNDALIAAVCSWRHTKDAGDRRRVGRQRSATRMRHGPPC